MSRSNEDEDAAEDAAKVPELDIWAARRKQRKILDESDDESDEESDEENGRNDRNVGEQLAGVGSKGASKGQRVGSGGAHADLDISMASQDSADSGFLSLDSSSDEDEAGMFNSRGKGRKRNHAQKFNGRGSSNSDARKREDDDDDVVALSSDDDSDLEVDVKKVYDHPLLKKQRMLSEGMKQIMTATPRKPGTPASKWRNTSRPAYGGRNGPHGHIRPEQGDEEDNDDMIAGDDIDDIDAVVAQQLSQYREKYKEDTDEDLISKYLQAGKQTASSSSSSSSSSALGPGAPIPAEKLIMLKFKTSAKDSTMVGVASNQPIGPSLDRFCAEHFPDKRRDQVIFIFDGEKLSDNFKPEDEDLENDDIIDVQVKP